MLHRLGPPLVGAIEFAYPEPDRKDSHEGTTITNSAPAHLHHCRHRLGWSVFLGVGEHRFCIINISCILPLGNSSRVRGDVGLDPSLPAGQVQRIEFDPLIGKLAERRAEDIRGGKRQHEAALRRISPGLEGSTHRTDRERQRNHQFVTVGPKAFGGEDRLELRHHRTPHQQLRIISSCSM